MRNIFRAASVAAFVTCVGAASAAEPGAAPGPAVGEPADAAIEEVVVSGHHPNGDRVSGRAGPWSIKVNPKFPYGTNDGRPPLVVELTAQPHERVEITAEGFATLGEGYPPSGPEGLPGSAVNEYTGAAGNFYPSRYIDRRFYPVNIGALIACFVDDEGHLVSRPFPIGKGVRAEVPEGATALSFGFNDDVLRDNGGGLLVTVIPVHNPIASAPDAPPQPAPSPAVQAPAPARGPPAGYVSARVDARASPWSREANPNLAYGMGDGEPPAVVKFEAAAHEHIEIAADGTTKCGASGPADAGGIPGAGVDNQAGVSGHGYPSRYVSAKLYPARRHALLATFVDPAGKAVTRPILVGSDGVRVEIPVGAVALALGFNDESHADCSGTLEVTVVQQERADAVPVPAQGAK